MKHYFSLTILVFMLLSCQSNIEKTYYPNGNLEEEFEFKGDKLKHGNYQRFSENGTIIESCNYKEGKLDGERMLYTPEGTLEIKEIYVEDKLNGPYLEYYPNGNKKFEATYKNNILEGLVNVYYPTGEIKEEVTFADNIEEGPFKEYYKNGNLMWEGTYKNGENEFGLLLKYDSTGTLIRKMMCDERAICTTTWSIEKEVNED